MGQLPDLEMRRQKKIEKRKEKRHWHKAYKKTACSLHAKAEKNKPSSQNVEESRHKYSIWNILCWKSRLQVISGSKSYFSFQGLRYCHGNNPFRIHQWDQECDVILKQWGGKDINRPPSRPTGTKKRNDIRKALGRDWCFLAPWK